MNWSYFAKQANNKSGQWSEWIVLLCSLFQSRYVCLIVMIFYEMRMMAQANASGSMDETEFWGEHSGKVDP